ncbi:MAG: dehydrogenase [Gemmatimonadetes bacterium]|nr:dehydrogenase [Gemmatimonadota bacterium]
MAKSKKAKETKETPTKLRVAFIGAGNRAVGAHYPSLSEMKDAEICAICELNEERRGRVAKQFRIPGQYDRYQEMVETEKPDVVYAIMPPHHVYDIAANVIEMGCNLILEKPPTLTSEQTRQLAILARKNKVITGVTLQRRFAPVIRTGKELCEEVGPVHSAEAMFIKYTGPGSPPTYKGAVDQLTVDGVHAVDTLRYLCGGDVESVASSVRRIGADHLTVFQALVTFSSGATGFLKSGYKMGRRIFAVEAHSDGISFFGDPEEGGRIFIEGDVNPAKLLDGHKISRSKKPYRAYGEHTMNRHFLDCIREGRQPETNLDDAIKTMELVEAIHRSQI